MSASPKRVLVAPLDWGLGHAARCVPVIRAFCDQGAEVILAADGRPAAFLAQQFPELELIRLRGYDITYPKSDRLALHLLLSAPRIFSRIREEREVLRTIIREKKIDIVVSDNRFGLGTGAAYSVYITHQLRVPAKTAGALATRIHRSYIETYDEVWVPDHPHATENFSGTLAHPPPYPIKNLHYVGPLTRFPQADALPLERPLLVLLSGPEPQRSLFEQLIIGQLASLQVGTLLLRGTPGQPEISSPYPWLQILSHLPTDELANAIRSSALVVARSGYSTLLDLAASGSKLFAVPTPGQPEQEYLAQYLGEKGYLGFSSQKDFSLMKAVQLTDQLCGCWPSPTASEGLLEERVTAVLR